MGERSGGVPRRSVRGTADRRVYELRWGFGPEGASHGLDTLLVFDTTHVFGAVTAAGPTALAESRRLSELIRAEHLAFAATGEPGWPRFRRHERRTRVYDPGAGLVTYPEDRSRRIWRDRRFGALDLRRRVGEEPRLNSSSTPPFAAVDAPSRSPDRTRPR